MAMSERFYQTVLNLPVRSLTEREDFFVSEENAEAVAFIDSFPNHFNGAVIFGEKGCGKTHLAHLFAEVVLNKTGKITKILSISAIETLFSPDSLEKNPYLVLENADRLTSEKSLFHLLNTIKSSNGFVLLTSEKPPVAWKIRLPDLYTRLKAFPCIEIKSPGEALVQAVLIKQFSDRQIKVSPDVIAYILKNTERSFKSISFIVSRSDQLSLERKNAITIPLIKQVLAEMKA